MLELRKGVDILTEAGGIRNIGEAHKVFDAALDDGNRAKLRTIKNHDALTRIANAISMCGPARVLVVTSSAADIEECRRISMDSGEECPLAMKDHSLHFDLREDQGRMVDQTFYICNDDK